MATYELPTWLSHLIVGLLLIALATFLCWVTITEFLVGPWRDFREVWRARQEERQGFEVLRAEHPTDAEPGEPDVKG